jgi:hypothetical protein
MVDFQSGLALEAKRVKPIAILMFDDILAW